MRKIRFRIQGSDARWFDAFAEPLMTAIPRFLAERGWQVTSPVVITRPAGWSGIFDGVIFDFQVSVFDSYANDYVTNEFIKEQMRSDLSAILDITRIVMPEIGEPIAPDTGGFIFDSANTQALKDAAKRASEAAMPLSIGAILLLLGLLLIKR